MSPLIKTLGIVGAVVAVAGGGMLLSNKSQQADPTLTAAPPTAPGAQAAQPMQPSSLKKMHPGPMYSMTAAGPVLNTSFGGSALGGENVAAPANTAALTRAIPMQYQRPKQ